MAAIPDKEERLDESLATTGRLHSLMGVQLLAVGSARAAPAGDERGPCGDRLRRRLDPQLTGIEERRHAAPGTALILRRSPRSGPCRLAGVSAAEIDLIVVATATPAIL
jgi:hypothetical protein